jgi:glutathione S-transferase
MKLYLDPVATTCRPVLLFLRDHDLPVEFVDVSLLAEENYADWYTALNPNQEVPVLDDDGFVLTESVAILKYLAALAGSTTYPTERQARARVDSLLDWFNTGFLRDYGYGAVYPRLFAPHYGWSEPAFQAAALARGDERADRRLRILDQRLAATGGDWLLGAELTLADYVGAGFLTVGELTGFDLRPYPHVSAWIGRMKARSGWDEVHAAFYGWRSAVAPLLRAA